MPLHPKEYQSQRNCSANSCHQAEHKTDLHLAPPAHFKMMMDGAHLKQSLSVGELEIGNLKDYRQDLRNIDDAQRQQQDRHIHAKCQCANHTAQEQRTGISHKHLGGVKVPHQKAHASGSYRHRHNADAENAGHTCNHHNKDADKKGNGSIQAVDSIREIHRVDNAYNKNCR